MFSLLYQTHGQLCHGNGHLQSRNEQLIIAPLGHVMTRDQACINIEIVESVIVVAEMKRAMKPSKEQRCVSIVSQEQ
jgi:hypothetical protein